MVRNILRLEGLIIFLGSVYFYYLYEGSWLPYLLLLFAPDISMVGYLKDKKLGAFTYNLMHNLALPIFLIIISVVLKNNLIGLIGLILLSHVGLDRFLGYGLKYKTAFKDTHLRKV
jgi:hypothetical protein